MRYSELKAAMARNSEVTKQTLGELTFFWFGCNNRLCEVRGQRTSHVRETRFHKLLLWGTFDRFAFSNSPGRRALVAAIIAEEATRP